MASKRAILEFLFMVVSVALTAASLEEDKQALLDFLHNTPHSHAPNWDAASPVCGTWTGIACDAAHARVVEVHLPGVGFRGPIPGNTIGRLSSLRVLSLRANRITGPFPSDFDKLASLTSIYLQSNDFSGPLPLDFSVWKNLTVIDLSSNRFNGTIPLSIGNLTHLSSLNLSRNWLSGRIPDLGLPGLQELDLSNNNLTGTVPRSLRRFPRAFIGNDVSSDIAVPPSIPVEPPENQAQPAGSGRKAKRLSEPALLGIAIGGCVIAFVIIALIMLVLRSGRDQNGVVAVKQKPQKKAASESQTPDKTNRLFFFEGCKLAFDLEDLLRASAEVLGKGTFGTTYKAALEDATTTLVVKRLKEVTVVKRDFEQQMEIVGGIGHENVVPVRAYYYSKDEKLIVYDFYEQGNVSSMLHGGRGQGRTALDWETRLRIATGAARGIAHIHTLNGGKLVHGNVKASNTFLNAKGYGCVSDIGLAVLMSPMPPPAVRSAGYRAPEVSDSRKATTASDVYSLGVLILELLTGKSPVHATGTEEVVHLVRWVNSVVREEWTAEVFDVELLRYPNIEEEMVEMLQLGMSCVARSPEKRPKIASIVASLEEIRQVGSGNRASEVGTPVATPVTEIAGPSSSVAK